LRPEPWTVTAVNHADHADNPIHTDAGAQAAGFPRALVAGVTTYAYLTHPIVEAWDLDWLRSGGGEVRFRSPVFDGDEVRCTPRLDGGQFIVEAFVDRDQPRVTLTAVNDAGPPPAMREGERLRSREVRLEGLWSDEYGLRVGDHLPLYSELGIVHPAVWPSLANHLVHTELARGAWIHTRSIIRHHGVGRVGEVAMIHGVVVDRFERSGERAVVDVAIEVDGEIVATLEHEAIVALPSTHSW
jgi:acyl dehydratase